MKNLKITKDQLEKSIQYHKLSKSDNFEFVLEDLKKQLKNARETTYRINSQEEMFRLNHTLNGYENCINYIETQIRLYKDYNNGIITIKEQEKKDED